MIIILSLRLLIVESFTFKPIKAISNETNSVLLIIYVHKLVYGEATC